MASFLLPVTTDPWQQFQTTLDGVQYEFDLHWNERDSAWYIDLLTADGEPISVGKKVAIGAPLFFRSQDDRKPPGFFSVIDTSGQGIEAGLNDLGSRVVITYRDSTGE